MHTCPFLVNLAWSAIAPFFISPLIDHPCGNICACMPMSICFVYRRVSVGRWLPLECKVMMHSRLTESAESKKSVFSTSMSHWCRPQLCLFPFRQFWTNLNTQGNTGVTQCRVKERKPLLKTHNKVSMSSTCIVHLTTKQEGHRLSVCHSHRQWTEASEYATWKG